MLVYYYRFIYVIMFHREVKRMVLLQSEQERNRAAVLFKGWSDTLLWTCLEGKMGCIRADDARQPSFALATVGDFSFCAGDANAAQAQEAVGRLMEDHPNGFALIVPQDAAWAGRIAESYQGECDPWTRYAFKKEKGIFDSKHLEALIKGVPPEYRLRFLNARDYEAMLAQEWSCDFCSQFSSAEEYQLHGIGVGAFYGDEMVCGASSYTYYSEGIEIEIDTKEPHRRRGLAAACAATLILECMRRDLYPSWDAANLTSVRLAQRLGYHLDHEYTAYAVRRK